MEPVSLANIRGQCTRVATRVTIIYDPLVMAMRIAAATMLVFGLVGCTNEDVGESCPMNDLGADIQDPSQQNAYPEVVEIDATFPCDNLICVSTQGSSAYCSKECRTDEGCPAAFECRQVSMAGGFAERKFCVWRACRVAFECGDLDRYKCDRPQDNETGVCALED